MAENVEVKKYLDLEGLQALWAKISQTYLRSGSATYSNFADFEADYTAFTNSYNEYKTSVDQRISEIEASTSNIMDGDTIVLNDGKYSTNLVLNVDKSRQMVQLITKDNKTVINEISYADLVLDGMLDAVSIVTIPSTDEPEVEGRPAGTYMKFVFNLDGGNKQPIYLNVSEFITVYAGSDYITVEDGVISLKVAQVEALIDGKIADITSSIQTIQGNVATLQLSIGELTTAVNDLKNKVTEIDQTVQTYSNRITNIENSVNEFDGRITDVETATTQKFAEYDVKFASVPTERITEEEIDNLQ